MRGPVFAVGIPRFRSALAPAPIARSPPAGTTIAAARTARPTRKAIRLGSHSPKTSWKTRRKPTADISSNPVARISHAGRPFERRSVIAAAFETVASTAPATSAKIASASARRHAHRAGLGPTSRTRARLRSLGRDRPTRTLLESGGRSRNVVAVRVARWPGSYAAKSSPGTLRRRRPRSFPGALVRRFAPTPRSASSHPSTSSGPVESATSVPGAVVATTSSMFGNSSIKRRRAAVKSRSIDSPGTVILESRCIPATSDRRWVCGRHRWRGRPARRSPTICSR